MKILMLIDALDCGGAETHLYSLCYALKKKEYEVVVASAGGKTAQILQNVGIGHCYLPSFDIKFPHLSQSSKHRCSIFQSANRLLSIVKKEKPDVIHAHTRKTAFIADLVCRATKIPLITTAHARFSMDGYKWALSRWGDGTIAVSEDVAEHIVKHSLIKPKRVRIIRNGVFI